MLSEVAWILPCVKFKKCFAVCARPTKVNELHALEGQGSKAAFDEVRKMADIAIIIGVQAVVMGAVAGANYTNNSDGFLKWMPTRAGTPEEAVPNNENEPQEGVTKKAVQQVQSARLGDSPKELEWAYKT